MSKQERENNIIMAYEQLSTYLTDSRDIQDISASLDSLENCIDRVREAIEECEEGEEEVSV